MSELRIQGSLIDKCGSKCFIYFPSFSSGVSSYKGIGTYRVLSNSTHPALYFDYFRKKGDDEMHGLVLYQDPIRSPFLKLEILPVILSPLIYSNSGIFFTIRKGNLLNIGAHLNQVNSLIRRR